MEGTRHPSVERMPSGTTDEYEDQKLTTPSGRGAVGRSLKSVRSIARAYFELKYLKRRAAYKSSNPDYEREREFAFSLLDDDCRYERGLEVGCGEGFSTHRIAARCDQVVATDVSAVAIRRARRYNRELSGITFRQHDLVGDPVPGKFDYIFCGEVLYYLRHDQFTVAASALAGSLRDGGVLHLLHHNSAEVIRKDFGADTICREFTRRSDLKILADEIRGPVRATVLTRTGAQ